MRISCSDASRITVSSGPGSFRVSYLISDPQGPESRGTWLSIALKSRNSGAIVKNLAETNLFLEAQLN